MELFVENKRVDVSKTFSTLLTLAIDDIRDFGSKNTTFSKTIIIPGTNNNNKLFGNIFNVSGRLDYDPTKPNTGLNFNAAINARAYIFVNNMQLFKGTFRILDVVIVDGFIEYECAVTGELGGFIASMGNKKLEDLDFSTYNHTYSIANITGSWNNASAGSGYYYPLIDYGGYSVTKDDWRVGTLRPAFFVKEYLDKIFANAGYSYNSANLNTTRVKSWIVPNNRKLLTKNTTLIIDRQISPPQDLVDIVVPTTFYGLIDFNVGTIGAFTFSGGEYTYTGAPTSASISIGVSVPLGTINNVSYDFLKNNISVDYKSYTIPSILSYSFSGNIFLNTGDKLKVIVAGDGVSGSNFSVTGSIYGVSSSTLPVPVDLGDSINANDILPQNILQTSFLSSILKLSNLYVFEDAENDKLLKVQPFIDFYADAESEDWSLKLDRSKAQRVKPMGELNSRYYEFNYASDNDYFNELYKKRYNLNYGSYKYDSEFEFSKESTRVDIIFAGTPLVGYQGQDKVYSTIFKKTNNNEESVDSVIRILQAKKITGVSTWNIKSSDNLVSLWNGTTYGYAGHLNDPDAPVDDLNFGVPKELFFTLVAGALNANQFNVFWSSYMAEITDKDSRLLTAHFKLDLKDIANVDFSKLKYIDGVLYRLNKIEDFNVSKSEVCKCELLKVINKIY